VQEQLLVTLPAEPSARSAALSWAYVGDVKTRTLLIASAITAVAILLSGLIWTLSIGR
jgi:hypothetical protein